MVVFVDRTLRMSTAPYRQNKDPSVATDATGAETDDNSVDDSFAEVVECVKGHDYMANGDEEFDEIVWEIALAVKECSINNPEAKKSLVDGWVSMEDNELCNNL